MQDITQELIDWLKERKATIDFVIQAPKGGVVHPDNYIPAGWQVAAIVQAPPKEDVDASPYSSLAE